jgi:hypothetical protein
LALRGCSLRLDSVLSFLFKFKVWLGDKCFTLSCSLARAELQSPSSTIQRGIQTFIQKSSSQSTHPGESEILIHTEEKLKKKWKLTKVN